MAVNFPRSKSLSLAEQLARLPAPQPGKAVSIPIELFPYWLEYHQRELMGVDFRRLIFKGRRIPPQPQQEATR
jgi:hypothetical protein